MKHLSARNSADRHGNALGRTAVESVDDNKLMQESAHSLFTDEQQAKIEHVHPYGFTNVPKKPSGEGKMRRAAEAFMSYMGAGRSHGIAMVVGDRRYRLYKLDEGEVALHDDQGQQVHLKRDGLWASVPQSKSIKLQIMDDDQMPQDDQSGGGSSGGGSSGGGSQAQKMGQVKQAGRPAAISIVLDKNQFTINHPNGDVNINCKNFTVTASNYAKLKGGAAALIKGAGAILLAMSNNYIKAPVNNLKAGSNLVDPPWDIGAEEPPLTD